MYYYVAYIFSNFPDKFIKIRNLLNANGMLLHLAFQIPFVACALSAVHINITYSLIKLFPIELVL